MLFNPWALSTEPLPKGKKKGCRASSLQQLYMVLLFLPVCFCSPPESSTLGGTSCGVSDPPVRSAEAYVPSFCPHAHLVDLCGYNPSLLVPLTWGQPGCDPGTTYHPTSCSHHPPSQVWSPNETLSCFFCPGPFPTSFVLLTLLGSL